MTVDAATREAALRERLESLAGRVTFGDLRAHFDRDAVFVVAASVALVECGLRVALDDVAAIGRWIESRELRRPSRAEHEAWAAAEGAATFVALVVQPFVLVQVTPGEAQP